MFSPQHTTLGHFSNRYSMPLTILFLSSSFLRYCLDASLFFPFDFFFVGFFFVVGFGRWGVDLDLFTDVYVKGK